MYDHTIETREPFTHSDGRTYRVRIDNEVIPDLLACASATRS